MTVPLPENGYMDMDGTKSSHAVGYTICGNAKMNNKWVDWGNKWESVYSAHRIGSVSLELN